MKKKILIFLLCFLFFIVKGDVFAADPHLFLSPSSGSYSGDFNLEIKVDTAGQAVGGVDVLLEFPKNLLNAQQVTKGTAFGEIFSSIKNDQGQLIISTYFSYNEAGKSYNGNDGLIATVSFKPLGSGVACFYFLLNPKRTKQKNIVEKTTSKDIIVCNANINGSYNLTAASSGATQSNPTPTPTSFSQPQMFSSSPTPTQTLPVAGSPFQTVSLLSLGAFILLTGLALAF
jgi:hypothetical protein